MVFRPLAGCGLFPLLRMRYTFYAKFPSPCGVWVVSSNGEFDAYERVFPSPCGVWVVSDSGELVVNFETFPSPLRGVGCFDMKCCMYYLKRGFRPLAGCGLFPPRSIIRTGCSVSVPLRGVGCFLFLR